MTRVTLKLTPTAAQDLRGSRTRSSAPTVLSWLTRPIQPVHAGTQDPALSTFFTIDVQDAREARQLVERLLKDPSVDGAYVKPDDELA